RPDRAAPQCSRPLRCASCARSDHHQEVRMKHWIRLLTAFAGSALVAAVATSPALAGYAATSGAHVDIAKSPLGRILVDSKGITLYDFPPDKGTTSVCYGACAALWPPVITHGKPVAGRG